MPDRRPSRLVLREHLSQVLDVVNRHDPIGLFAAGCPHDEYEAEANAVISALRIASNERDLEERVKKVFAHMFSPGDVERFKNWNTLAKELWMLAGR